MCSKYDKRDGIMTFWNRMKIIRNSENAKVKFWVDRKRTKNEIIVSTNVSNVKTYTNVQIRWVDITTEAQKIILKTRLY